jgi:hypothetical protein
MASSCAASPALFLVGALAFATAATILSGTFDWPDILREPWVAALGVTLLFRPKAKAV